MDGQQIMGKLSDCVATHISRMSDSSSNAVLELIEGNGSDARKLLDLRNMLAEKQERLNIVRAALGEPAQAEAPKAKQKIDDFGEKLEGAKKHMREQQLAALSDDTLDIAAEPLSKTFPAPNYAKLEQEGVSHEAMAFIALARNEIPAKPKVSYKLKRWVEQVKMLRDFAHKVLSGEITMDRLREKASEPQFRNIRDMLDTAEALSKVPAELLPKAAEWRVRSRGGFSIYRDLRIKPNDTVYWLENAKGRETGIYGTDREEIISRAADTIAEEMGSLSDTPAKKRYTQVSIYQDRHTKDRFLGFDGRSGVIRLKTGFESFAAAGEYLAEHRDELQAKIDEMRKGPQERRPNNMPRKGVARRDGDVTPEQFNDAFGFRGVQFGNYVEGDRRQAELNEAFDALMDMADVLGVPPKALSLNGELGLAFGARGSGNAKAHYEPGNIVINITKTHGAGSLAHEWLHALDGYFHRQAEDSTKPGHITDRERMKAPGVREEVQDAWRNVMKAIKSDKGDFLTRAKTYDDARSKPYWSTNHELAARAFERYMLDRINEAGGENDYLVNLYKEGGAYPTDVEMIEQGIRPAFDKLFETIETRETDKGVAMYSRSSDANPRADEEGLSPGAKAARALFGNPAPQSTVESVKVELASSTGELNAERVRVVQSIADLPAKLRKDALESRATDLEGLFDPQSQTTYLIADNIAKGEAFAVLMHEAGVHMGMRGLIGDANMKKLAAQLKVWAAVEKGTEHGKLAKLAMDRIPDDTPAAHRDEELIAYFVTEAVKAGHGDAKPDAKGPIARWFAKLWDAVKSAIAKLGTDPAKLTTADVVALARGALERSIGETMGHRQYAAEKVASSALPGSFDFILPNGLYLEARKDKTVDSMISSQELDDEMEQDILWALRPENIDRKLTLYAIQNDDMETVGFALLGSTDGVIDQVANIELYSQHRGKGYGRAVVGALLNESPSIDLHWVKDQPAADAWRAMGSNDVELEGHGTITRGDFDERIKEKQLSGIGREDQRNRAARSSRSTAQTPAGDSRPLFSRSGTTADTGRKEGVTQRINEILSNDQPSRLRRLVSGKDFQKNLREAWQDLTKTGKTFHALHRTIGTQYNKALRDPEHFGKAFQAAEDFIDGVTRFATRAADQAPDLLPRLDRFSDAWKQLGSYMKDERDAKAVSAAIFNGTMEDKVYGEAELRERFGLNAHQIRLYEQFRSAVNQSLDDLAASELAREASAQGLAVADRDMTLQQALKHYVDQLTDPAEIERMKEKVQHIEDMQANGYAPLMRFGRYTVDVTDTVTGEREGFLMFEDEADANEAARALREEYGDDAVKQGVLSEEGWKAFKDVNPESLEAFAKAAGMDQERAFQEYLKLAVASKSAMKRLIKRGKVPGYTQDVSRVLATFVTSNSRMASKNWNMGKMIKAVADIPKEKGDSKDEAARLLEFVSNPEAGTPQLRNLMFVHYMGGSIASAVVNMTQTFTTTLPYLASKGQRMQAVKAIKDAMKMAAKMVTSGEIKTDNEELKAALQKARDEGVTDPQEIHQLYAEGNRNSRAARALGRMWGGFFGVAEKYNRAVTFIAAYDLANQRGVHGAAAFAEAEKAVRETQFLYTPANRPNWARSPLGALVFTFKQFSISYMEFLSRLPNDQKAIALGVLVLLSGVGGLPGADDLDDVIDALGQQLGYDTNAKGWKQKTASALVGDDAARWLLYGVSAGMPLDVSGRLSMGNLLPATGVFKKSNPDKVKELTELAGPAGSYFVRNVLQAWDLAGSGYQWEAAKVMLPKAFQDAIKGADMHSMGMYRDTKGRKVMDTDAIDAFAKAIGFHPSKVGMAQKYMMVQRERVELAKIVEADLADRMARARFENDAEGFSEAYADYLAWNTDNPESRIGIDQAQIRRRLKQMHLTQADRLMKTTPKEMRGITNQVMAQ